MQQQRTQQNDMQMTNMPGKMATVAPVPGLRTFIFYFLNIILNFIHLL